MSEAAIRLSWFLGVFGIMALWEVLRPTRQLLDRKPRRWSRNLLLMLTSTLVVRLVVPFTAIGAATFAAQKELGLFHSLGIANHWVGWVLAVMALDLFIYLQHVIFHVFTPLWRLHMVHHADEDFDVTTASRFHPVEIALSMLIKCVLVIAIGASPTAVLIFEILLNAAAVFNHANVSLPNSLDHALRWVLVTPDMHRVHHSQVPQETNSNFGFNLPWWDRICGTYTAEAAAGRPGLQIGLKYLRDTHEYLPLSMLGMPLTRPQMDADAAPEPSRMRVAYAGILLFAVCCVYGAYAAM